MDREPLSSAISESELRVLAQQLGREPRAVRGIEKKCLAGHPLVIRVYPLVDEEPFPTLFWLTCPRVVGQISKIEHEGFIQHLESLLSKNEPMREAFHANHQEYIKERWNELSERDRAWIKEHDYGDLFLKNGIGGIRNWNTIKCLHLHYAHHLARQNVIGEWVDQNFSIEFCQTHSSSDSE